MNRWLFPVVALLTSLVLIAVTFLLPISIRNAAPFGSEQTIDFDRGIAVLGAEVTPNYDGFDRLGLDLRAYSDPVPGDRFDFVVSVREIESGTVVRQIAITVGSTAIPAAKSAFSEINTEVRFPAIEASAGVAYYIDLERGPRNVDDVVTLWGVSAYSTVTAASVLGAAADGYDLGLEPRATRFIVVVLLLSTLMAISALIGCIAAALMPLRHRQRDSRG